MPRPPIPPSVRPSCTRTKEDFMKAVVYHGPRDVRVERVPDPMIEAPADVLIKITTACVCGSDLHVYEGRTGLEPGRVLGHENLGEVIETGSAVERLRVGDRVCVSFNIGCGYCMNCERGRTAYCLVMNPVSTGAAFAFDGMGPYNGGRRSTSASRTPTSTAWSSRARGR